MDVLEIVSHTRLHVVRYVLSLNEGLELALEVLVDGCATSGRDTRAIFCSFNRRDGWTITFLSFELRVLTIVLERITLVPS